MAINHFHDPNAKRLQYSEEIYIRVMLTKSPPKCCCYYYITASQNQKTLSHAGLELTTPRSVLWELVTKPLSYTKHMGVERIHCVLSDTQCSYFFISPTRMRTCRSFWNHQYALSDHLIGSISHPLNLSNSKLKLAVVNSFCLWFFKILPFSVFC